MAIEVFNENAAQELQSHLEQRNQSQFSWGVLHIDFVQMMVQPSSDEILRVIRPALADCSAALYIFDDGDAVITFKGPKKQTAGALSERIYAHFMPPTLDFEHYYDSLASIDALRRLCLSKGSTAAIELTTVPLTETETIEWSLTSEQKEIFKVAHYARDYREFPQILIVEDQLFSSQLLHGLLIHQYKCTVVSTAKEAWAWYIEYAPDIVYLDIELPDIDGHMLARELRRLDPKVYIVMVSGHSRPADLEKATENATRGFIVKPYSKQKILDSIKKYQAEKKSA